MEIILQKYLPVLLTALCTFLIWRIQHHKDKLKNIESQLSEKKYKIYSELLHIVFDIAFAEKTNKNVSQENITVRILNIKKDMFLYGSDEIFKLFTEWTLELNSNDNSTIHFKTYFKLLKLARKDMGHYDTKLELDDFMLFLLQSEEEYMKFKELNNW